MCNERTWDAVYILRLKPNVWLKTAITPCHDNRSVFSVYIYKYIIPKHIIHVHLITVYTWV